MANEKTRRSSKSADHKLHSQLTKIKHYLMYIHTKCELESFTMYASPSTFYRVDFSGFHLQRDVIFLLKANAIFTTIFFQTGTLKQLCLGSPYSSNANWPDRWKEATFGNFRLPSTVVLSIAKWRRSVTFLAEVGRCGCLVPIDTTSYNPLVSSDHQHTLTIRTPLLVF